MVVGIHHEIAHEIDHKAEDKGQEEHNLDETKSEHAEQRYVQPSLGEHLLVVSFLLFQCHILVREGVVVSLYVNLFSRHLKVEFVSIQDPSDLERVEQP